MSNTIILLSYKSFPKNLLQIFIKTQRYIEYLLTMNAYED